MRPKLLTLLSVLSIGCVSPYRPPQAHDPHAIVKLRRSYDTVAGVTLFESVEIDEHPAFSGHSHAQVAKTPRIDSLLAHPVPATFSVRSDFFHIEQRWVTESYQVPHTVYTTQSYSCSSGFGTNISHHTCSRTVSQTTYETRYRMVRRSVAVSDGACSVALRFAPENQHVYLLQYTYQAPQLCTLACYEQVAGPDGGFTNLPCPAAPPAAN